MTCVFPYFCSDISTPERIYIYRYVYIYRYLYIDTYMYLYISISIYHVSGSGVELSLKLCPPSGAWEWMNVNLFSLEVRWVFPIFAFP